MGVVPTSKATDKATRTNNKEKIKLSDCKTLGDMFANVHHLVLPCQAMSLLDNPNLFYLIMLNPNATEIKERLSFTLYHTLHNEFFSQTGGKGKCYNYLHCFYPPAHRNTSLCPPKPGLNMSNKHCQFIF